MSQHFLSAAYPAMAADEFQSLKDSIELIGVQTPVTMFEGQVLDGWHRWTAALELGVKCPTVELGDVDPRDFVRAVNGKSRRHLTQSQLAAAEVALWEWAPAGKPNLAAAARLATNAEMAAAAGVSERTISDAKVVAEKATPEVQAAVKAGTMSVEKAAATTKPAKPVKTTTATPRERDGAPSAATVTTAEPSQVAEPDAEDSDEQVLAKLLIAEQDAHRVTLADNTAMGLIFDADDKLATAVAENKKLRAEVTGLRERVNGLLNEKTEAIRLMKSWRSKAEKAEKAKTAEQGQQA